MAGKIIIIHPSEIIRKGLQSMLRPSCQKEILLFKNLNKYLAQKDILSSDNIFITHPIFGQKIESELKLMLNLETPVAPESNQFSLQINAEDLRQKISILEKEIPNSFEEEHSQNLTEREIDVLKLIALGNSNKEIAEKLFISIHTVITHRKNITEKLSIKSISGLTVYALLNNLIDSDTLNSSMLS